MIDTGLAWIDLLWELEALDLDPQDLTWAFPFPPSREKVGRAGGRFFFPQGVNAEAVRLFDLFDGSTTQSQ